MATYACDNWLFPLFMICCTGSYFCQLLVIQTSDSPSRILRSPQVWINESLLYTVFDVVEVRVVNSGMPPWKFYGHQIPSCSAVEQFGGAKWQNYTMSEYLEMHGGKKIKTMHNFHSMDHHSTGSTKTTQVPLVGNTDHGDSRPIRTFEAEARQAHMIQCCAYW